MSIESFLPSFLPSSLPPPPPLLLPSFILPLSCRFSFSLFPFSFPLLSSFVSFHFTVLCSLRVYRRTVTGVCSLLERLRFTRSRPQSLLIRRSPRERASFLGPPTNRGKIILLPPQGGRGNEFEFLSSFGISL